MDRTKKALSALSFIVFLVIAGFSLYRWFRFETIDGGSIFFSFLSLSYFINLITWGHHESGGEKDELDKHIVTQSAKIGYFVLVILGALILFISEGVSNLNDIQNLPLLIVVSLSFVILPATEFIIKKRY